MKDARSQDSLATPRWHLAARGIGRRNPQTTGWLFRDIALDLEAGDRLALVGPTGSGKSLVLRALALLDPIDQGKISWNGEPIGDAAVPGYRSRVLYLQQRSPVIEGTVEDNLRLPYTLRSHKDRTFPRPLAAELLERLGQDPDFLDNRTASLSGGERQLVALLRALLVEPPILLLDEPSAALDPQATAALERLVETWYRSAPSERALIWVSHDPEQAHRVADTALQLRQGELVNVR